MSKNDARRGSMVGRDPRGSMVGAPPTKSTPTAGFGGGRSFLKVNPPKREKPAEPVVVNYESESEEEEEEDTAEDTPELEQPASSSSKPEKDKAQDKEGNKSPVEEKPKRKRKKRRLRLTDGLKSKKRAERKEKQQAAVEKKEAPDSDADVPPESPSKKEKDVPEEEVIKAPPPLTTYTPFQLLCDNLLRKLISKDPEEFFANPVLASTAPDYLSVISSPMDFSSMRRKVESNEYGHIAEFKADVQLVVDNAMTYNPPTSIYHLAASKLAVVAKYYLSDQYLTYLRYSLPFGKDIPMELMGLNNPTAGNGARGGDVVRKGTTKALNAISDNVGSNDLMNMAEKDLKNRLTSRLPNCQLGYLDNKDGALALNILTGAEKSKITLGDFVKKLDKGNPGICTPAESRLCVDYPITYTNTGPFSSFAPQFDSTWATLSKRDSDLLTACYGDQANAAEAIALRQMVADSGDSILGIVDGFLDKLTDGEHSRTIKELEKGPVKANHSSPLNELLEDVKSLENIGLDLSFVNDLKVDLGLAPKPKLSVEQQLRKTGRMVTDLAGLNYNRLSNQPAVTLTDAAALSSVEVQLADNVLDEFGKEINGLNVKPADLVSSKVIHESLGLNDDDYDVLREFMVV